METFSQNDDDSILQKSLSKINKPTTREQQYYRDIYDKEYPNTAYVVPYFWMPQYVEASDSSARTLDIYNTSNTNVQKNDTGDDNVAIGEN